MANWKYKRFKVTDEVNDKLFQNVVIAIGLAWKPKGYQFHDYSANRKGNTILYKIIYKKIGIKTRTVRL